MNRLFSYVTLSLTAIFVACVPSKDDTTIRRAMTPQDSIISNIARTSFSDKVWTVNMTDSVDMLDELQSAIDSCSYYGGGTVHVTSGVYHLAGTLMLKSNVNLNIATDATLLFSGLSKDYLPAVLTRWEGTELYGHSPMIYAYHATNIAITGKGCINAQGGKEFAMWSEREAQCRDRLREMGDKLVPVNQRLFGEGTILRPSFVQFIGCSRILVEDITLKDSPFWTIHPVFCDNVIVRGVTIDSHFPNNDGCDPESTSNVLIENCTFRTGDDAVAIKAGRDTDGRSVGRPSENIVVRNCKFYSECNGLCIGSEMSGGVANVYMDNVVIGTVKNAIYFKSNKDRGGYIRNVHVDSITIERARGAILRFETNYFGYRDGNYQTSYEDFNISNVYAQTADNYAIFMEGNDDKPITDIVVDNFHVEKAGKAFHVMNIADVRFTRSSVNGDVLPEILPCDTAIVVLDVY